MQPRMKLVLATGAGLAFVVGIVLMRPQPGGAVELPSELAQARQIATDRGCVVCHSLDGEAGIGPTWRRSWGSLRQFEDGSSQVFDAAYLRQSVTEPAAKVVKGFQNLMLPVALTDHEFEQLERLLAHLAEGAEE